jgi:hypothetical protein
MKKVLCSHTMNTTNFICKDPDLSTGGRFYVPVIAGVNLWVDERIVKVFPSTFTPVEAAPVAQVEAIEVKPDDASDEASAVDPEQLEQAFDKYGAQRIFDPLGSTLDDADENIEDANAKETADEVDAEILTAVIAEAEKEEVEILDVEAEAKVSFAKSVKKLDDTIDAFTNKKALDDFGAELGVKLDRRTKLADMKLALKEALKAE